MEGGGGCPLCPTAGYGPDYNRLLDLKGTPKKYSKLLTGYFTTLLKRERYRRATVEKYSINILVVKNIKHKMEKEKLAAPKGNLIINELNTCHTRSIFKTFN